MASSPKKKTPAKKKAAPKKAPAKKTTPVVAPKKVTPPSVTKKAPAKKKAIPKVVASKTIPKKAPTKKTLVQKNESSPQAVQKTGFFSESQGNSSIFTTVLAILIVAFVVLGGYIYSKQAQKMEQLTQNVPDIFEMPDQGNLPPPAPSVEVAPSVTVTPEMQDILRILPSQLLIEPGDKLTNVSTVTDVALLRSQNPTFYKNAVLGDYILQFDRQTVLFRSNTLQVINVEPVSAER